MKILYVITGLSQGGAERVVCDLADAMFAKGHTVKIAYLTGNILTSPVHQEIELVDINLTNILSLPKAYLKLSYFIKNNKPDVVHAHMVHANIFTRLIRLTTPMSKLICTAHSSNEGGILRMLGYRITDSLANLTTNVSNTAVNSFETKYAVPKYSMVTVYNGVDFKNFNYIPEAKNRIVKELSLTNNTKIILAVGRFSSPKNYSNLLNAIRILKDQSDTNFILLIAGDGEMREKIEQLIRKLKINNNVMLLGRRRDIAELMSACDVFVLSSDYEGLPTVLIEALACQAHVVSTDVSGAREIVGDYGYVVPTKNSEKLSEAIIIALNLKEKNILGKNYAKSKFDINIVSKKWLDIYNEK